jgi:Uma2 family endonuclease
MATTKLMTADELMALPDDGWQYELIEGVLHRMSPAGTEASAIAIRIGGRLDAFAFERRLGKVTGADGGYFFDRDPDTVRALDVAFVRTDRLPPADQQRGYSPVVPDLAVEVVSPGDSAREVAEKVAFYLAHGVPLVWVVRPRPRTVTVHPAGGEPRVLGEGDVLDGGDVLPGFRLRVADLFR